MGIEVTHAMQPRLETFEFIKQLLNWFDRLHISWEEAERTVRRACSGDGATIEQLAAYFLEAHDAPATDRGILLEFAASLGHLGRIRRTRGGRYISDGPANTTYVIALVEVPLKEWENVRAGGAVRTRAAWVVGEEDEA